MSERLTDLAHAVGRIERRWVFGDFGHRKEAEAELAKRKKPTPEQRQNRYVRQ